MAKMHHDNDNGKLPKTRAEALASGVSHYFTGKPCRRGHVDRRRASDRKCLACQREYASKWHEGNADTINERKRNRYAENVDRERERNRAWRVVNGVEYYREYHRKHRANDPKYRTNKAISRGIGKSLKSGTKAGRRWESLVGYTIDDLMRHLENQFSPGMTWDNYGKWEIDHIIPLSAHNFATPEDMDFKKAWDLGNLRPLWSPDNRSKGSSLEKPFQPSLALAIPANDNSPPKKYDTA